MMSFVWSVVGFLVAMGLLVTIHEWGHYFIAKRFNIKVLQFSIGFGRSLYSKKIGETEYRLGVIPLGGYVKFADERDGEVKAADLNRTFNRQNVFKRFAVVAAGPLINLLFAWIIFSSIYWFGAPGIKPVFQEVLPGTAAEKVLGVTNDHAWQILKVNDENVSSWKQVHHQLLSSLIAKDSTILMTLIPFESNESMKDSLTVGLSLDGLDLDNPKENWFEKLGLVPQRPTAKPVLDQVVEASPADKAGFKTNDLILMVNNQSIRTWNEFVEVVQKHPGKKISVTFERDGAQFVSEVVLDKAYVNEHEIGKFGASVQIEPSMFDEYKTNVQYPLGDSLRKGFEHSLELIDMSLVMLKRMLFGEASIENLSGPITIADFSGQALQTGWVSFLSLLGLLSLSLGILNLLPVPMLDGGHLAFYLVEMVKGSPVNEKIEGVAQRVGLLIILGLTFIALFNDIIRISDG